MLRIITLCICLAAASVSACETAKTTLDLRDLIYADDIDGVERMLGEEQRLFEVGAREANDMRCLFAHFDRMRPQTFDFVAAWVEAHPNSPFALTARAWTRRVVSWQVRGDKPARSVYPDALREFSRLQRGAWADAEAAYRANPRLIAATDALIVLANANGQKDRRLMVLNEVMETDPNWRTLRTAVSTIIPGWGGRWETVEYWCATYAPQFAEDENDDAVTRCKLPQARWFKNQRDWKNKVLLTGAFPLYEGNLLSYFFSKQPAEISPEHAQLIHDFMASEDYFSDRYLSQYEELALHHNLPTLAQTITTRRYEISRARLEHEPLSLQFLRMARDPIMQGIDPDTGEVSMRVIQRPTEAEMHDYARRIVQAAPYDVDGWTDLSAWEMNVGNITNVAQFEPYRINAIVYSNHTPDQLAGYIFERIHEYDMFQKVQSGKFSAEIAALFDGLEEERDFLCPIIRAARLKDRACENQGLFSCQPNPVVDEPLSLIEAKAKKSGVCFKERTMPVSTLAYSPMPLPTYSN